MMRRRDLLKAGALAITASAPADAEDPGCKPGNTKGTFVLVHGANQGAWIWRDVETVLRLEGYQVFTPTLTGLGALSHRVSPNIGLRDHIADIVNVIDTEELDDVLLVGHSYGGTVVTGACDALRERIKKVVFLDANAPEDGQPTIPGLTPELVEKVTGQPPENGYLVPALPPARLCIDPADEELTALLERRMTGHPIRTLSEPLELPNGGTQGLDRTFVLMTPLDKLQPFARKRMKEIDADESWNYRELLAGHQAMLVAPCEVAELLLELVEG